MSETQPDKEYWFARDGNRWWSRFHYSPVHWKGFAALFGAIMGSIWMFISGGLLVILGGSQAPNLLLRILCVIAGLALLAVTLWLASYSYRTLRKRVDPVNTSWWYWKRFLNLKSEETK